MNKIDPSEIDTLLNDFPENMIGLIKGSLDTRNVSRKLSSRNALVKMGKSILPQLHKLSLSEN